MSTALLPTRTNMNPGTPAENEYYDPEGTILVLRGLGRGPATLAQSSGDARRYYHVGDTLVAHHDQAGYTFGVLTVVGIVHPEGNQGEVPNRKLSLRVFK